VTNYIIDAVARIARYLSRNRVEPQIVQKCDRSGKNYWQVYDPVSGSSYSFSSEKEVRAWLDTRYYHSPL
jgi:hypothetical protein